MNQLEWQRAWQSHLSTYLVRPARTGAWLKHYLRKEPPKSILELACGSARDAAYLSRYGHDVTASDFERASLEAAEKHWSGLPMRFVHADAFDLPFSDKSFDLSFHNGLYIYFTNDEDLVRLIREQARVTKETIIFINHNAGNLALRQQFQDKARTDPVYDIRFFTPKDIDKIVEQSNVSFRRIEHFKFGGFLDALGNPKVRGLPNLFAPFFKNRAHLLYPFLRWPQAERVISVVTLDSAGN